MSDLVRRVVLPVGGALVASLLAVVPVQAAPVWVAPSVPLSSGAGGAGRPELSMNAAGDVVAVWEDSRDGGSRVVVQASVHPAGGVWSPPVDLSSTTGRSLHPQVDLDAAGNSTVVWQRDGATPRVEAVHRPVGGSWSGPGTISNSQVASYLPKVAVDDAGIATVIWNAGLKVFSVTRPAGGGWTAPVAFSASTLSTNQAETALAVTPGGFASAAWIGSVSGREVVTFSDRPPGSEWTLPQHVSVDDDASGLDIAASAAGGGFAALTWLRSGPDTTTPDPDDTADVVQSRVRPGISFPWGGVTTLSDLGGDAESPQVSADARGRVTVVWTQSAAGGRVVQAAQRNPDWSWNAVEDLSATGVDVTDPAVAMAGQGDAVAVWRVGDLLQEARRPVGASGWQPSGNLSDGTTTPDQPRVVMDALGNAAVAWQDQGPGNARVRARALDATGPALGALTVPAKISRRDVTTMSVTARDTWSPYTLVWSFGDGRQATGPVVSHSYADTGRYTVTVTATDALGNVSSLTQPVTVLTPVPRLSGVRLTRKRIHVVTSRERPRATRIKLSLNTDAKVVVKLRRTERYRGRLVRTQFLSGLGPGEGSIRMTSRIFLMKLPPGTYRLSIRAHNFLGTSAASVVRLKIVP